MAKDKEIKRKRWVSKLKNKYRLVFMNDDTLEERLTFRLSRLNVFVALGALTIVLIFLTSYLIAFTPLREYIPGYPSVALQRKLYQLQFKTDSIERDLIQKDLFLKNLKDVINGKDLTDEVPVAKDTLHNYKNIKIKKSIQDSLLRIEVEGLNKYSIARFGAAENVLRQKMALGNILFFVPLKGMITSEFDPASRHLGVDVVAKKDEAVKAVLDGAVIMSDWTIETGYVILIQHQHNLISVYKHNSALMKRPGDIVKAGEPIAIIGESGEIQSGPHLHFELWNDGTPVNPKEYISF